MEQTDQLPEGYGSWKEYAAFLEEERETDRQMILRLTQENDYFRHAAGTDKLTRLWNKGAIDEMLEAAISHSDRTGEPLSITMVDIDHFKNVNDTYGHLAGDSVLERLASYLRTNSRRSDMFGRYGGEEFMGIFVKCEGEKAVEIMESLRMQWLLDYSSFGLEPEMLTFSAGVAGRYMGESKDSLVYRADKGLYKAKGNGRDQVVLAHLPDDLRL